MRRVLILILAAIICAPSVQANHHSVRAVKGAGLRYSPAQEMLQSLDSMSTLLNSVYSRQAADAAVPQLSELYKQYIEQRNAAENMPIMSEQAMTRHMAQMDSGMNTFRLACARLIQAKFYDSAQLGRTVKRIAQDF